MADVGKWCLLVTLVLSAHSAISQTSGSASPQESVAGQQPAASDPTPDQGTSPKNEFRDRLEPGTDPENRLVSPFLKHLVSDQKPVSYTHLGLSSTRGILSAKI